MKTVLRSEMTDEKSTNQLTPDQEVAYSKTLVEISEKQLIKGRVVGIMMRCFN